MLSSAVDYVKDVKSSANFTRALVGLIKQPKTENIVEFLTQYNANMNPKLREAERAAMRKSPVIWQMIEARHDPRPFNINEMEHYAPGTLGHAYRQFMIANGFFNPDFVPTVAGADECGIFSRRMAQTHDLWHVVTGYKTDLLGEFGNAGFYMGQFHAHGGEDAHVLMRLSATLVAAASLYAALFDLVMCRKALAGVVEGWHMGQKAKPLFALHWETMWDRPLNDICNELEVVPVAA